MRQLKPETEIRNLKQKLRLANDRGDVLMRRTRELEQKVRDLTRDNENLKRDNGRLEEIADLARRLAGSGTNA